MNLQGKTFMKKYVPFILSMCLIIGFSSLTALQVFSQSAPDGTSPAVTGITAGRARSLAGGVIALISLIIGWRANSINRSSPGNNGNNTNKRTQAIIALSLGGIAIILSLVHLSTSAGAVLGSGSGKAGAFVALVLALIGMALGGLALRPKRERNMKGIQ